MLRNITLFMVRVTQSCKRRVHSLASSGAWFQIPALNAAQGAEHAACRFASGVIYYIYTYCY